MLTFWFLQSRANEQSKQNPGKIRQRDKQLARHVVIGFFAQITKNHQEITCDCRLVHWHPVCTFLRPYAGKIAKRRHYIFRCTCVLHGHGQQQNTIALSFYRVWIRFQVRLLPCGVARRFLLWLVLSNNCQLHYNGNSEHQWRSKVGAKGGPVSLFGAV